MRACGNNRSSQEDTAAGLSPNLHFDPANCGAPDLPDDANEVRVQLCEVQRETLVAGFQRHDASDEMQIEIGGVSDNGQRGAFLQAMLDYVDRGPPSLDDARKSRRGVAIDARSPTLIGPVAVPLAMAAEA
jgi:hypothetical protein